MPDHQSAVSKHRVASNVIWNWAGTLVQMVVGFLLAPFLVRNLGEHTYGLWILISSMTGYFGLLDVGVRGSVGRYLAYHKAKNDTAQMSAILSTALAVLAIFTLIGLMATAGVLLLFFKLFTVPADNVESVRIALAIVGVNLALSFLLNIFDSTLWAFQRFDVLNAIDIPAAVIRAALSIWLVASGYSLVTLACIVLAISLAVGFAKAIASFRLEPNLRARPGLVTRAAAGSIFSFGGWCVLMSLSRLAANQISPLLVGSLLGVVQVTPFSVASRLVGYATSFVVAASGVFTPLATTFCAQGKTSQQRELFITGGKYCAWLAGLFFAGFVLLGKPLIMLWMGTKFAYCVPFLTILAAGELVPMSQLITQGIVLSVNRHRAIALLNLVENVAIIGLVFVSATSYGLMGVCIALAVCAALFRGIAPLAYLARLFDVPLGQYCLRAVLPSFIAVAIPTTLLWLLIEWKTPETWASLIAYMLVFSVGSVLFAAPILVGKQNSMRLCRHGMAFLLKSAGKESVIETLHR